MFNCISANNFFQETSTNLDIATSQKDFRSFAVKSRSFFCKMKKSNVFAYSGICCNH